MEPIKVYRNRDGGDFGLSREGPHDEEFVVTTRAEFDALVKERDALKIEVKAADCAGRFMEGMRNAATARADKAEALLRRVRAATRHRDQNTCDVPHALSREIDAHLAAKGQTAPTPADPTNPAPAATSAAGCTELKEP